MRTTCPIRRACDVATVRADTTALSLNVRDTEQFLPAHFTRHTSTRSVSLRLTPHSRQY